MELREIKSFIIAAKLRSVTRAAEQLGVGQPTVTNHIKKLEEELGMVLFDRVKRPIQLTLAGQSLVQLATPLIEGIEALAAKATTAEQGGPVSIASTADIIPHTLLQVVRAFRSAYPEVYLRMQSCTRSEAMRLVESGEVDMGIMPGPDKLTELDFRPLFIYERVLITPRGHPLLRQQLNSLEQIAKWPLILMPPDTYTRQWLENEFKRKGLHYDVVMELSSMDVIKRYVALGMGISVGPKLAIDPVDVANLGMVSLASLMPVEQAGIVTLRGKALSTPAQRFIEVLERTLLGDRPGGQPRPPAPPPAPGAAPIIPLPPGR